MHILHVTPHLPPDQAANALLPWQLGTWALEAGDTVAYVAHPPRAPGRADLAGPVTWVPRRARAGLRGALRIDAVASLLRMRRALAPAVVRADVVHVHSNGLLAEAAVLLARRLGRPVVLTLYGTEIWHYQPKRFGPDLFRRAYQAASIVTFYSERLLARARELGLTRRHMETVYPAVGSRFVWHDARAQSAARAGLGITNRHLLLNVKRLHPLAGQRDLLEAMNGVVREHPDTRLVICGTGALLDDLRAVARSSGVERHVTFAGLLDNAMVAAYCAAADLFVLPSLLEALPTVAVEALAAGTPVLSTDNPGGLELNDLFGPDVATVPRAQPIALALAVGRFLRDKRRTTASTRDTIERDFRASAVACRYRSLYERAVTGDVRSIGAAGRVVATGLLSALAATVWLAFFYGISPDLVVRFDTEPPALLTGVYPTERDPVSGRTFAWTGEQLTLRLPGLDRRVPWNLSLRVRGARVQPADNPQLRFLADGVELGTRPTATDYGEIAVLVPPRAELRGLTLAVRASATFVPGPSDPRPLGVMLDEIRLAPSGVAVPPRSAFAGAALAAAAMGAAIAALGVTAGSAILAALVVAAGISSTVARGFAPYTDFPGQAGRAGLVIAVALGLMSAGVRLRMRGLPRNTARFALAFSACALLLELLLLLHPDMPIGDALFHAHRFQDVLAGRLYFTSVAPGNYLFPYAPGLYVVASAFADLVARGNADMALLRIVTATANAASAALLYWVVVRSWGDRLAAACAVALYHLIPLGFGILTVGNLTNAFAQALSVLAFVLVASGSLRLDKRVFTGAFILVLVAAFLSHTSTFAILSVACVFTAVLFSWRAGPALRASGFTLAFSLAAAVLLAVVLYYAHFAETYRTELARIGQETLAAAPDAGGRGILTRLLSVPRYLNLYFGMPALILAGWGAGTLWKRPAAPEALTRSIAGWALACSAFLVLGIVTPVDMRYYLASIPLVAMVAGYGASAGWSAGGPARALAAGLLAWALAVGVRGWWSAIG